MTVCKTAERLTHAEKFANFLFVNLSYEASLNEVALLLLGLLRENVTVESVLSLDLTRSGERETLLSAGISLYFRHLFVS